MYRAKGIQTPKQFTETLFRLNIRYKGQTAVGEELWFYFQDLKTREHFSVRDMDRLDLEVALSRAFFQLRKEKLLESVKEEQAVYEIVGG